MLGREPWRRRRPGSGARIDTDEPLPSWSPSGELLVRALETGVVSRVVLETGELIPVARLSAVPMRRLFDEHLMTLPDGDLLAVDIDRGFQIMVVAPDAESQPGRR